MIDDMYWMDKYAKMKNVGLEDVADAFGIGDKSRRRREDAGTVIVKANTLRSSSTVVRTCCLRWRYMNGSWKWKAKRSQTLSRFLLRKSSLRFQPDFLKTIREKEV